MTVRVGINIVPLDGKPGTYNDARWQKDELGCEWEDIRVEGRK